MERPDHCSVEVHVQVVPAVACTDLHADDFEVGAHVDARVGGYE